MRSSRAALSMFETKVTEAGSTCPTCPMSEVIPCHPVVVFERNSKGEVPTTRRGVGFTAFDFFL